jgi:hypothetical protein
MKGGEVVVVYYKRQLVYHVIMFQYSAPLAGIRQLEPRSTRDERYQPQVEGHSGEFEHHTHLIANYSVRHRCPPRKSGLPVAQTMMP